MKLHAILILMLAVLIGFFACQKTITPQGQGNSGTQNGTAPNGSYLRKTKISVDSNQIIGSSGAQDSIITNWTYDSQNRVTSQIIKSENSNSPLDSTNGLLDSTIYSYATNENTVYHAAYANSALVSKTTTVNYIGSNNHYDSTVTTGSAGANIGGTQLQGSFSYTTYYTYNTNGNEWLDSTFTNIGGIRTFLGSTQKSYVNNSLSQVVQMAPNGAEVESTYYSAGNEISDTTFGGGTVLSTTNYTYTNILAGGFYGYTGNADLQAGVSSTVRPPVGNSTSLSLNFTYTFDSNNRVSTVITRSGSGQTNERDYYTYY